MRAPAVVLVALVPLAACGPVGKEKLAEEARAREAACSAHCPAGTCDNLGRGTSIHDVPCTPDHAARLGEPCSKHVNCASGLRCTDDAWKGRCAAGP